jgi:hypothetical protein
MSNDLLVAEAVRNKLRQREHLWSKISVLPDEIIRLELDVIILSENISTSSVHCPTKFLFAYPLKMIPSVTFLI